MNEVYKIGKKVMLKLPIHYEGLKKGDDGIVIKYEEFEYGTSNSIPLNRIECMVEFWIVNKKNKKIQILEPFTLAETVLYLEKYKAKENKFFD